ncbi:MAG TPA: DUF3313 family protein [Verrucomicrobiales bacterium]|nr:DUF3313 family protein [Verrucomicrobiales bacterium]
MKITLPSSLWRALAALCCTAMAFSLSSCAFFKAKPAAQTTTLHPQADLSQAPASGQPFHVVRRSTSPAMMKITARKQAIQVLPVDLGYLKPMGKTMARMDQGKHGRDPLARRLADYTRARFQQEVNRYAVPKRGNFLTLHLAITEFTPTSPSGNVLRTAAGFFIGPVSLLGGRWTNGVIAVEGEVRDPATGRVVFQFADREADPLTIVSVRSFQPDAFARVIVDQWAKQFAQVAYGPAGATVKDASVVRINPF